MGATPRGGVNRQALTPETVEARRRVARWAAERGLAVSMDEAANLFLRRAGTDPSSPPVLSGSHLDTQPTGGRFDGAFGVLAGLEALEALEDARVPTRRAIEVVAWTNEEGSRFAPGTMGSAVFAAPGRLIEQRALLDADGVRLGDALDESLAALSDLERRPLGGPVAAYVEAHIEQGPRLEREGIPIGAVTGIQGLRWFEVEVSGTEAHAGTTPRATRRDALLAALDVVAALRGAMGDEQDVLRFTVGRFQVFPGSPNTVPGRVLFTIDLRHPDSDVLAERGDRIPELSRAAAGACETAVRETMCARPVQFDPQVVSAVERAAERLELPCMRLPSGAGHDAMNLAAHCPTGMVFVPCEGGVSHNEAESVRPEDLAAGAQVLTEVLFELAGRP